MVKENERDTHRPKNFLFLRERIMLSSIREKLIVLPTRLSFSVSLLRLFACNLPGFLTQQSATSVPYYSSEGEVSLFSSSLYYLDAQATTDIHTHIRLYIHTCRPARARSDGCLG